MRFLIVILLFVFKAPLLLEAQSMKVVQDFRTRTTLGIEKELTKQLNIYTELESGLEENISYLGKLHAEGGFEYEFFRFLDLQASYRFSKNRKNYSDEYKYTHRLALAAQISHEVKRLKMYYRLQYQNTDEDALEAIPQKFENLIRNRLKFKYNVWGSKIDPFCYTELYLLAGNNGIDATKLKTLAGIEFPVSNKVEIKLYYRNDRELSNYIPYTYHTTGMSIYFEL